MSFRSGSSGTGGSSSNIVVNKPANVQEGDLLIVSICYSHSNAATYDCTAPAGWTQQVKHDASYFISPVFIQANHFVFTKVAGASEPTSYTFTATVGGSPQSLFWGSAWACVAYSTAAFDVVAAVANDVDNATGRVAPAVTPTGDNSYLIAIGTLTGDRSNIEFSAPDGMTIRESENVTNSSNDHRIYICEAPSIYSSPGVATPTRSFDNFSEGDDGLQALSAQLALTVVNVAPTAPTLVAPAEGIYADLGAGYTFDWTFNDINTDLNDSQSAYALRRKIGAGAYEYWRASDGTWQAAEVKNVSADTFVTFAAGKWTNGNTYQWSVKTWDQDDAEGVYASDRTVTASTAPTATITSPIGTLTDTIQPTVNWNYADAEADAQDAFEIVIESGSFGAVPGSGATVYSTGTVLGSSTSHELTTPLTNNTSYRLFVRVRQAGGLWSAWDSEDIDVDIAAGLPPELTLITNEDESKVTISIQGRFNMLTANQASLETDTTGWVAGTGTAIARSTAEALSGSASLEVSHTSGNPPTFTATTLTGTSGVVINEGTTYTALASFMSSTTERGVDVGIAWYDSGGVLLSTDYGTEVNEIDADWIQATVTAVAPANAEYAAVVVRIISPAGADVHYVDQISLHPGTSTEWSRGGLTEAAPTVEIQRSDDGGSTWVTVRGADTLTYPAITAQLIEHDDYEFVPGDTPALYRSIARNTI